MPAVILASTSPRRHHLLALMGVDHEIRASEFDEYAVPFAEFPSREEYVQAVGAGKVLELSTRLTEEEASSRVILGGDLTTFVENTPYYKPRDFTKARESFLAFTGKWHEEIASLAVWSQEKGLHVETVSSRIFTPEFTNQELELYLQTAQPLDKSGGYSIGAVIRVLKLSGREKEVLIEGEITTILGFPVTLAGKLLNSYNVRVPTNPEEVERSVTDEILTASLSQSGQPPSLSRKMKI